MARISKLNIWFKHFINERNRDTFMNRTASAKAAGYRANSEESFQNIGYQNYGKLEPKIKKWMDEEAMSESALHEKYLELKSAKETKFFKVKGYIDPSILPPGVTAIATSGLVTQGEDGENECSSNETLIMTQTDALHIQRQILDMGYKIRGTYKPDELKISGVDGIKIEFVKSPQKDK